MSTQPLPLSWPAIHGIVFVGVFLVVSLVLPALLWPWFLLLPIAAYYALVAVVPPFRRTVPRLSVGRVDWRSGFVGVLLIAVTVAALLSYQANFEPDVSALAASLPVGAFGNLILAGICFCLLNALLEEWIFRGLLYEALAAEWGVAVAIGVTAVLFGLGHRQGYPPGPVGVFLAAGYGVALGLLRWWTGGLAVATVCHMTADATIFTILVAKGDFAEPTS